MEQQRGKSIQELLDENSGPGLIATIFRTLVGLALVVAIGAGIFFGAAAIEGDDPSPLAPWTAKSAPNVTPESLTDQ